MTKKIKFDDENCNILVTGYDLTNSRDLRKLELLREASNSAGVRYNIYVNGKLHNVA